MALATALPCTSETFNGLSLFGAEIVDLHAALVTNYSASSPSAFRFTQPSTELQNATFCNVTVTYTHLGQSDSIHVETWLPVDYWNGRLQAVGGGGWVAGRFFLSYGAMVGALADGYATVTTDAGLGAAQEASPWALNSPGNVNLYNLQNMASVSLNDEAIISKALIESFYGEGPRFSYWNGCSQGGRQGLMLAQRYPTAYDGIAAGAPAINFDDLGTLIQWPQQFMSMTGNVPHTCEIDAINAAAIATCDALDGVIDGIIGEPEQCLAMFDPFEVVGELVSCSETAGNIPVSIAAAAVVNATWSGIRSANGRPYGVGFNPGSDLTGSSTASHGQPGIAATNCSSGTCVGVPSMLGQQWLQYFVLKDPEADVSHLSHSEFDRIVHASRREWRSMMATDDPDLTDYRAAGGKIVTFHGLADGVIPPKSTENYYREVAALIPGIRDFFRHYEAPGLGHCFGGPSGQPSGLFEQLRAWVENGTAPESTPVQVQDAQGVAQERILCPYPEKAVFEETCGEAAKAECWHCEARPRPCLRVQ